MKGAAASPLKILRVVMLVIVTQANRRHLKTMFTSRMCLRPLDRACTDGTNSPSLTVRRRVPPRDYANKPDTYQQEEEVS